MPRNFGKGGKKRKKGKHITDRAARELVFKDVDQEYGQILKNFGGGRLEVYCFDGKKRIAHIRGKMMKRDWMTIGDIVLVSLRGFEENKGDIIHKYTEDEARKLKSFKEIPENVKIVETGGEDESEEEDNIEYITGEKEEDKEEESKAGEMAKYKAKAGETAETAAANLDKL